MRDCQIIDTSFEELTACEPEAFLTQYDKIYIWGQDDISRNTFITLINKNIKVAAFLWENRDVNFFFNVPVMGLEDVDTSENYIIISRDEKSLHGYNWTSKIWASSIDTAAPIAICGMGKVGEALLGVLRGEGNNVAYLFDSSYQKCGEQYDGLVVQHMTEVAKLGNNCIIICCGKAYQEIYEQISSYGVRNPICYVKDFNIIRIMKKLSILDTHFYIMNRSVRINRPTISSLCINRWNQKFLLVGEDETRAYEYARIMGLLNFDVSICAEGQEYECLEDVLYGTDRLICLTDAVIDKKLLNRIGDLGLKEVKDYVVIGAPDHTLRYSRKQYLDVDLGYGYYAESPYPGFEVYGELSSDKKIIVTLGGSTTDGGWTTQKSWPQILYEKYLTDGSFVVMNTACVGYNSVQEMLKLARDVVLINPVIVITYDGYNDTEWEHNSFENKYLNSVFAAAKGDLNNRATTYKGSKDIFAGIEDKRDWKKTWLSNLLVMKTLCGFRGIDFCAFKQPMLASKENRTIRDNEKILMATWFYGKNRVDKMRSFRYDEYDSSDYDWIYDLSDIFDGEDVYYDTCHVNERGNEIIADRIMEKIKSRIEIH